MNRRSPQTQAPFVAGLTALSLIFAAGAALAQEGGGQANQPQYEQRSDRDVQLRLGVGLDKSDDGDAEGYYSAALRFRIGRQHGEAGVYEGDTYRGRPPAEGGIRGYLEPEVAYWSRADRNDEATDLLVGANLIGVVPTRGADFFVGVGFGYHFFDSRFVDNNVVVEDDDDRVGGNLQVGVDVNLGSKVALFGTGRIDILEGSRDNRQTKVFVGLRFKL